MAVIMVMNISTIHQEISAHYYYLLVIIGNIMQLLFMAKNVNLFHFPDFTLDKQDSHMLVCINWVCFFIVKCPF